MYIQSWCLSKDIFDILNEDTFYESPLWQGGAPRPDDPKYKALMLSQKFFKITIRKIKYLDVGPQAQLPPPYTEEH